VVVNNVNKTQKTRKELVIIGFGYPQKWEVKNASQVVH